MLPFRELGLYVECAYGVYIIPEEVYTKRQLVAVAEYIDDRASCGKLSRFVYIVNLRETVLTKPFHSVGHIGGDILFQMEGVTVYHLPCRHFLRKRFRIGHHIAGSVFGMPLIEGFGA